MSRGVLYIAWGEKGERALTRSPQSLREVVQSVLTKTYACSLGAFMVPCLSGTSSNQR